MSDSNDTNLHDIHFELKATADTKTTTGVTDNSYVCKNGSFLKDKDNDTVKTGSNLIPSNWSSVQDKVTGNYNMFWFNSALGDTTNCSSTQCQDLHSESTNPVNSHVTPGIGKPLFIVPDTNNVFLFARPTTSTTGKKGGQYYMKDYEANKGNTKLYQDYAKSSPVGLASGTTSKAVRLRMENQETSGGSSVDQREWLQACSQCNPGYTLSEGKQKPKKVCKRWVKVNTNKTQYLSSQHGRNKPYRLLGKIRYNDGGSSPTPARDHFVPFGVANNRPWNESNVDTTNYKFQPYDGSTSFWGKTMANSYYSAAFKTNSQNLMFMDDRWNWFPIEKNDSNTHKVPLINGIDCEGTGTTGSGCNRSGITGHYNLAHDLLNTEHDNWVYGHQSSKKTLAAQNASYGIPQVSADDIYCGYTAGNNNVAGTYTNDEAQKRWRSLFFQNIYYYDSSNIRHNVENGNQLTSYLPVKTNITYYSQSNNTILWDKDKYHGCVKCPPGTSVIDKGCQRCPNFQWSSPVRNQNQTCEKIKAELTSNYSWHYGMTCGKATMSNEGNMWCGSGGKYGLRNCNASDGNSIETGSIKKGSRDKHVCTQYDSSTNTFGSYHGIRNLDCSHERPWTVKTNNPNKTCFKCTCPNGTPVGPKMNPSIGASGCDTEGQNKCKSCNKGYYLDKTVGSPTYKQCKPCPAGTYQHVSNNTNDRNPSCISCGPGRHLPADKTKVSECVQNTCTCKIGGTPVGTAATETSCTTNNGNICASCYHNYYLDAGQCKICGGTSTTGGGVVRYHGTPQDSCQTPPSQGGANPSDNLLNFYTHILKTSSLRGGPEDFNSSGKEVRNWCLNSTDRYKVRKCKLDDGSNIDVSGATKQSVTTNKDNPKQDQYHVCLRKSSGSLNFDQSSVRKTRASSGPPVFTLVPSNNIVVTSEKTFTGTGSSNDNSCFKCQCSHGKPAAPKLSLSLTDKTKGCEAEGQNKCKSCNAGYYLDKTVGSPTYKQCKKCDAGTHSPAGSTQKSDCVQNQCTCNKKDSSGNLTSQIVGTAATGPACTSPGGNLCASCKFNHYLDTNKQCQVCARTNNKPTVQYRSDKNTGGTETCLPVTDKWVTNFQVQCDSGWCGGNTASGYRTRNCNASDGNLIDITTGQSNQHHVCLEANYHGIRNSNCSVERPWTLKTNNPNQTCFKCTCLNGVPVGPKMNPRIGASGCDNEGQNKCQSCDTGFHLVDRVGGDKTLRTQTECASKTGGCKCVPNTCKCEIGGNTVGTPATGPSCKTNNGNLCASCYTGHRIDNNKCKKTYCNISAPNNGGMGNCSNVLNHGSECQPTCNDGYRLDRNNICDNGSLTSVSTCIANRCTCSKGTATNHQSNPKCRSNGETQCISCHAGYRLVDRDGGNDNSKQSRSNEYCKTNKCKCVPNICTCSNGTKATTTTTPKCLEHNKENCISCSGGFKLDTGVLNSHKCIKTLDCIGGNNAPIQVKDNFCESCYFNHYLKNEKCIVCINNAKGQPTVQYRSDKNKGGIETCLPVTNKWVTNLQAKCPSAKGWCSGNTASGYKTRNCNAKDGHNINIELQSITKTTGNSNQHHVCLSSTHHGIRNSDCSVERNWTVKTNNPDKTCFKCKCSNGTPVGPKMGVGSNGCGQEGENHCKKCNGYYHLVDISEQKDDRQKTKRDKKYCETNKCKCVKNVCSCPGGTPSPDGSCLEHGGEHCKICNPNRELDQTGRTSGPRCREWAGSCLHGKLIDIDKRLMKDHCGSCNAGYTINKKTTQPTCRPWDDKCLNGNPISKISDRTADGQCGSCNPGYHLVNKKCIKCIDGTYTSIITGFPTEYCSIPGIGETILTSTKKAKQTCSCPNGTGSSLDNCSTDLHTQKYKEAIIISGGTEIQITQPNNIKVKGIKTPLSSTNSQSLIRILRDRHKQNKTQRLTCSSCNQDYHLKKNKCNPNICQCPSGCVKIIEDTGKTSAFLCNGSNQFWDKISGKCYNCIKDIEATKMIGSGVASKCSQHEEEACVICTKPGTWLNGGKCVPWSKCKPGQIQIKEGTNRSDRVCGSSGPCPKGQWESKAATATRLRVCKSVGVCRNGLLISPVNQKQTHHCQSCNPGYRLCENRVECEKSSNKPSLISDPDEKRRWLPYRDCVMNVCKCSNGTSVTGNPLSPKSSPKCTKNNQEMCEKCKPGFYLVKEIDTKGNPKQRCVPWTECLNSEWIQQSGSQTQNRICKPCPQGTLNQNYSKNNNLLGKITDCKCNSGYEIPVKDDQGKITDLKCGCLNGSLQEIKTGEKDCVCNSGYHGGGKKNNKIKDMSKYKPYGDCMITNKCKCSNGVGATNIPCDLRSIKSINDKRVTNTSDRGECPFVNSRGNVWKPSMGPLSSPVNAGFKQSNKTCPQNDEELCESCFDGFELNKKSFVLKGKIIKAKTRCVPVNDPSPVSNQVQPTPKPSTQTKKEKQTNSIRVPPQKINTIQVNNATSQKFQQMIKYNQR